PVRHAQDSRSHIFNFRCSSRDYATGHREIRPAKAAVFRSSSAAEIAHFKSFIHCATLKCPRLKQTNASDQASSDIFPRPHEIRHELGGRRLSMRDGLLLNFQSSADEWCKSL